MIRVPVEEHTLSQSGLATRRLTQNGRARTAKDNSLGVREDGRYSKAPCRVTRVLVIKVPSCTEACTDQGT